MNHTDNEDCTLHRVTKTQATVFHKDIIRSVTNISHGFTMWSHGLHHSPPLIPILHSCAVVVEPHSLLPCCGSTLVPQLRVLAGGSWVLQKANICWRPACVARAERANWFPLDCAYFWGEWQKFVAEVCGSLVQRTNWGESLVRLQGCELEQKSQWNSTRII